MCLVAGPSMFCLGTAHTVPIQLQLKLTAANSRRQLRPIVAYFVLVSRKLFVDHPYNEKKKLKISQYSSEIHVILCMAESLSLKFGKESSVLGLPVLFSLWRFQHFYFLVIY